MLVANLPKKFCDNKEVYRISQYSFNKIYGRIVGIVYDYRAHNGMITIKWNQSKQIITYYRSELRNTYIVTKSLFKRIPVKW